jgi:uncharacterized protein YndB with AHSA1/START domain
MKASSRFNPDPKLDLVLERVIDAPRELVWEAWTKPEHLMKWFVPKPWSLASCELDLRPGGAFNTVMRSPEGAEFPGEGCFLEVVPNERLVWTDALVAGYRPSPEPFFTAALMLEPHGSGTRYVTIAMHRDEDGRKKHEEMGFHHGWGKALDQLVELLKTIS